MAERTSYLAGLWRQRAHKRLAASAIAAYGALGFFRDDVLPYGVAHKWWDKSVQSHLTVLDLLGDFSWRNWLLIALGIVILLLFEAGFRLHRSDQRTIARLTPQGDLKVWFDPNDPRCVTVTNNRYGPTGENFAVIAKNVSNKTLQDVTVYAKPSWVTSALIAPKYKNGHSNSAQIRP